MAINSTVQRIGKFLLDAQTEATQANCPNPSDFAGALIARLISIKELYYAACNELDITPEHEIGDFDTPPSCPE